MAPEALVEHKFSTASDVWAFGVLCWEILTLGQEPFSEMTNEGAIKAVLNGTRLPKPPACPDGLYVL